MNKLHAKIILLVTTLSLTFSTFAEPEYHDFSFANGSPFGGQTIINDNLLTLTSFNTQPFGKGFRDLLNTSPSDVEFLFSENITEFALKISYVLPPDEFLTNFNIGLPDTLTGTLGIVDGVITSTVAGDGGYGELIWSDLNTNLIQFTIGNLPDSRALPALAIEEFAITSAVPELSTFMLFGVGVFNIWLCARRREKRVL